MTEVALQRSQGEVINKKWSDNAHKTTLIPRNCIYFGGCTLGMAKTLTHCKVSWGGFDTDINNNKIIDKTD